MLSHVVCGSMGEPRVALSGILSRRSGDPEPILQLMVILRRNTALILRYGSLEAFFDLARSSRDLPAVGDRSSKTFSGCQLITVVFSSPAILSRSTLDPRCTHTASTLRPNNGKKYPIELIRWLKQSNYAVRLATGAKFNCQAQPNRHHFPSSSSSSPSSKI